MKQNHKIKDSINENLSGLYVSGQLHAKIMNEITGGEKVKKKLTLGLVLAIVLILAAVTALAVSVWQSTSEKIAPLQAKSGYFEDWSTAEKVELVRILREAGELSESPDAATLLIQELPDAEKERLANSIMTQWTDGTIDTVGLYSVMEKLHGPIETWSLQDKVWYNEMLERNGLLTKEDTVYLLPEEHDVTQQQAIQAAKDLFNKAFGVTYETLDTAKVEVDFSLISDDYPEDYLTYSKKGDRIWSIVLRVEEDKDADLIKSLYWADLTNTGKPLAYIEVIGEHTRPIMYLVPQESDLSKDAAILIARKHLKQEVGLSDEELDQSTVDTFFWLFDVQAEERSAYSFHDHIWTVSFRHGEKAYKVDVKSTGEVLVVTR